MDGNELIPENFLKLLFLIKLAGKIEGKTRLHKMVFLGEKEEGLDFGFEFEKYNYGPYSFGLTKAVDALQELKLIDVETILFASSDQKGFQTKQFSYTLTSKAEELTKEKEENMKDFLVKLKLLIDKWNKVPRSEIIKHVYSKYM